LASCETFAAKIEAVFSRTEKDSNNGNDENDDDVANKD